MDFVDIAILEDELYDQLRRNSEAGRLLTTYLDVHVAAMQVRLSVPLLTERESDTLRGNIAGLQKLKKLIHNGGTQ